MYEFIDWVMILPEELELQYNQTIEEYEEELKVAYITTAERIGLKKGLEQGRLEGVQQGRLEGVQALLARQLRHKFKRISSTYLTMIQNASPETIDTWAFNLLNAKNHEEVFFIDANSIVNAKII